MDAFLDKKAEWRQTKKEEVDTVLKTLAEKVSAIREIVEDDDKPRSDQKEEIKELLKDSPESLVRVIHALFPHYCDHHQKGQKRDLHHHHRGPYSHERIHIERHGHVHHGRHHRSVDEVGSLEENETY